MLNKGSKIFAIRSELSNKEYLVTALASFFTLLLLWSALGHSELVDQTFLPGPNKVFLEFTKQLSGSRLWSDVAISFYRVSLGFLMAAALGIPLGIFVGTFKLAEAFFQPITEFIRYMPIPAFIPLIIVWAGIGEEAKVLVIFMGTFFQFVLMVADSTKKVSKDLLDVSYTLGAGRFQIISKVLIPSTLPNLMDIMRMMIGWAWTYLLMAELVASNSGLGYSILKAQRFLKTDYIFVGILVIGILGLLTDRFFYYLNKRLFPWIEGGNQ